MMPGFFEVSQHEFYGKVWPRIKNDVEAIESNWAEARDEGIRPILIKWGHKNKNTGESVIVAITQVGDNGERHWTEAAST